MAWIKLLSHGGSGAFAFINLDTVNAIEAYGDGTRFELACGERYVTEIPIDEIETALVQIEAQKAQMAQRVVGICGS